MKLDELCHMCVHVTGLTMPRKYLSSPDQNPRSSLAIPSPRRLSRLAAAVHRDGNRHVHHPELVICSYAKVFEGEHVGRADRLGDQAVLGSLVGSITTGWYAYSGYTRLEIVDAKCRKSSRCLPQIACTISQSTFS